MSKVEFCFQIQLDRYIFHTYRRFLGNNKKAVVNRDTCEQLGLLSQILFMPLTEILLAVYLKVKLQTGNLPWRRR